MLVLGSVEMRLVFNFCASDSRFTRAIVCV